MDGLSGIDEKMDRLSGVISKNGDTIKMLEDMEKLRHRLYTRFEVDCFPDDFDSMKEYSLFEKRIKGKKRRYWKTKKGKFEMKKLRELESRLGHLIKVVCDSHNINDPGMILRLSLNVNLKFKFSRELVVEVDEICVRHIKPEDFGLPSKDEGAR